MRTQITILILSIFTSLTLQYCDNKSTDSNIGPLYVIEVTPAGATVEIDSTYQFTAIGRDADMNIIEEVSISWSSRYPTVGTVDQNGLFTAKSSGTTFLTAKSETVESPQIVVDVYDPVFSIEITPDSTVLKEGEDAQLTAIGKDLNGDPISDLSFEWESNDPNVATVDQNGNVHGVAEGTTRITAKIRDVESLPVYIEVLLPLENMLMGGWNASSLPNRFYLEDVLPLWNPVDINWANINFSTKTFCSLEINYEAGSDDGNWEKTDTFNWSYSIYYSNNPDEYYIDFSETGGSKYYGILEFQNDMYSEFILQLSDEQRPSEFESGNYFRFEEE